MPDAPKECINQAALRWPRAQGGLPREMVFELSTSRSAGKKEGVRGTYPNTRAACAKAWAWRSVSLRRLSVGLVRLEGAGCGELRGQWACLGVAFAPRANVCLQICVCVCVSGPKPACWGGKGAGGPEQRPDGTVLASSPAPPPGT